MTKIMEPKAVNTLVKESENLRLKILNELNTPPPAEISHLFDETSQLFDKEIISSWRLEKRFDELIDYIIYMYGDYGGDEVWMQVLLDLRNFDGGDKKAMRLLEGLLKGRKRKYNSALKLAKKRPDSYFAQMSLAIHKGTLLKILYEYAYLLENKDEKLRDEKIIKSLKQKIESILVEKQTI